MSDKSKEELEDRVDELESTVKQMLPNRRQAMKGMATAAGAGMLGFSAGNASAQASTSDSDGNVGDPNDRVDVFSDGVDANLVNTEKATIATGSVENRSVFRGHGTTIPPTSGNHTGFTALVANSEGVLYLLYDSKTSHAYDGSATLRCIESTSGGKTWTNDRELVNISSTDVYPRAASRMDNGRLGVLCTVRTGSNSFGGLGWLYSDDDGSTWTFAEKSTPARNWSGDLVPYPSSAGGADNGGWVAYTHDTDNEGLFAATTTDYGDTWTDQGTVVPDETGVDLTEPSVARVGNLDKWVMIIRDNSASSEPMLASRSTDLLNWESTTDAGIVLGANRPKTWYADGRIHILTSSRDSIPDYGQDMVYTSQTANAVWNDLTTIPRWVVAPSHPEILGYPDIAEVGGEYVFSAGFQADGTNYASAGIVAPGLPDDRRVCIAYPSTSQSVPGDGTTNTVAHDSTKRNDFRLGFDASNNQFVVREPGTYRISVQSSWQAFTASGRIVNRIHINGGVERIGLHEVSTSDEFSTSPTPVELDLSLGDTITHVVSNNSGNTETLAGGEHTDALTIEKLPGQ